MKQNEITFTFEELVGIYGELEPDDTPIANRVAELAFWEPEGEALRILIDSMEDTEDDILEVLESKIDSVNTLEQIQSILHAAESYFDHMVAHVEWEARSKIISIGHKLQLACLNLEEWGEETYPGFYAYNRFLNDRIEQLRFRVFAGF